MEHSEALCGETFVGKPKTNSFIRKVSQNLNACGGYICSSFSLKNFVISETMSLQEFLASILKLRQNFVLVWSSNFLWEEKKIQGPS